MKKTLLGLALIGASTLSYAAEPLKSLDTQDQKVSYSFGLVLGKRMTNDMPDLQIDVFVQGLKDAYSGNPQLITDEQVAQTLSDFQRDLQQKQLEEVQKAGEENKKAGKEFLAENKNKEGIVTLESGLQYKVLTEGKGLQPGPTDVVKVHYTGSLINGTVFDSSIDRGQPVSFPVNGVIAGWTEALQLMPTGSKWQLFIPSDLAYGPNGNRSIGPNETLLFDVELLDIEAKK
ncbi:MULTISPECIES: FKBP-type peptidyl-prolyl cis-trans isomerase [unclassified Oleiphilus]|uniref:FKBP-type peptidyl-prolyl cis-trans isomerase N-terminal domain-containing protein n=1 Tax=unclassified Oleiphilus TaxID=2631174 RepID=UPI0007C395E3|nr:MULTISPECIES: FKBP-type peptidyl-prolyl cis-trans isomerase [unclassified Oleiphilus]KZY45035.1 peptidylprolyl isomerase [Oleiphilus sp. HI0050]KZY76260.1 peptidylprolyl isomerase [Oleiphilus sp. HI0069]KZY84062.1 peptidylprolyl isomerase [Oleiphilus sp. HI0068]KZY86416.1 peptidylprolyl isomerase [Oleiphilus sp. HI0072]KZY30356.1 peptidylprolyl isomerase [Oleiphilus sp. HI0043]